MTTATTITGLVRYLDLQRASIYTSLSIDTLRRKIKYNELTAFRPAGGKILLDVRELDALVRRSVGRQSTRGQHLQAADDIAE